MQNIQERSPEINALEAQAFRSAQAGRDDEAVRLWNRILELDPGHTRTLKALDKSLPQDVALEPLHSGNGCASEREQRSRSQKAESAATVHQ